MTGVVALEKHFTVKELADLWGYSETLIRSWFVDEPGVLKHGVGHRRGRRGYVSLRVPESVALRVHGERSRGRAA
jgi:hypothetical protein